MKKIVTFFRSLFSRPDSVIPALTARGVLLCIQRPSGSFESREIIVFEDATEVSPWYIGRPVNFDVLDGKLCISSGSHSVVVFEGGKSQCHSLLAAIRLAWLEAHQSFSAQSASALGLRPAFQAPTPAAGRRPRRWGVWMVALTTAVVFVTLGAAGMQVYVQRSAPGLDLSSMSIEEVATLDANPVAIRRLQDQMTAAMKVGQAEGQKLTGKIEEDHVSALKAMGLQPGVSVKNAMACLGAK